MNEVSNNRTSGDVIAMADPLTPRSAARLKRRFATVLAAIVAASGFAGLSASPAGAAIPDRLTSGQRLLVNESIVSANGCYTLQYQNDGNLVIYNEGRALKDYGRTEGYAPGDAELQYDGNFVVYGWKDGMRKALYASDTANKGGIGKTLIMQGDGNLVLYNADWRPVWSSRTVQPPTNRTCN